MMSIVLLRPVVIATERSTDRPCELDMFDTTRSFTHMSNTCVIRRLAFLNLGFIGLLSCTALPATLHNLASQNSGLSANRKISSVGRSSAVPRATITYGNRDHMVFKGMVP